MIIQRIKLCEKCKQLELEKAYKALSLNDESSPYLYPNYPKLLAASSRKPTLHIMRRGFAGHSHNNIQLRAASAIKCPEELKRQRDKAEKAMNLNYGF
jgi:hypothetical protein